MGAGMEANDIDPRYPAEYQRGGDSLPRVLQPPPAARLAEPPAAPPAEVGESVSEPAGVGHELEPEAPESWDEGGPAEASGTVPVASQLVPWTVKTWLFGLGAGIAVTLLGLLCLLPRTAPALDIAASNYILVTLFFPLTDKVLALGPFLVIAGLGMLVLMLLAGAPRHPRASLWLRSGAALVAVAALVAAGLSLFAVTMRPELLLQIFGGPDGTPASYPWIQLTYLATVPLELFGLFTVAFLAIFRPNGSARNVPSAGRAAGTGAAFLAAAAVTYYAPQIFTGALVDRTFTSGSSSMQLTPWPITLVQVGPYFLLVGLAALLLALFLRLTTPSVDHGPAPADDVEEFG